MNLVLSCSRRSPEGSRTSDAVPNVLQVIERNLPCARTRGGPWANALPESPRPTASPAPRPASTAVTIRASASRGRPGKIFIALYSNCAIRPIWQARFRGRLAQLGERLPYKQEVACSSHAPPTKESGLPYSPTSLIGSPEADECRRRRRNHHGRGCARRACWRVRPVCLEAVWPRVRRVRRRVHEPLPRRDSIDRGARIRNQEPWLEHGGSGKAAVSCAISSRWRSRDR